MYVNYLKCIILDSADSRLCRV